MIAVALKGLAGRKVRALLTAFAVVIGVSMVSGTFILTDTMQKSFDGIFNSSTTTPTPSSRARRSSRAPSAARPPFPQSLLAKVRALPEVEAAGGTVSPEEANPPTSSARTARPSPGRASASATTPPTPRFSPLKLKTGEWAEGPDQVVIDAGTAAKQHYEPGDTVVVSTLGEQHTYEVTGTASFGDVDSLGFASIAAWDVETAQKLLHSEGRFDTISLAAKDGHVAGGARRRRQAARPGDACRSRTATSRPTRTPQELNSGMADHPLRSCSASAASRCSSARS